ncbi:Tex family protein [Parapedobacter sp. 10938]|uniref:Tex family protein n=1 Tax=Parapedobacter flavus TaxID=3110225 RepID=UPI002DB67C66|nr:Tex family protein [Parapedobacter sp. 10938]MEC3880950.1 Tex family protein [Parapedobacter sp. 10938]
MSHHIRIGQELALSARQVSTAISLLDDGATIPFISRYRKEMTGSLDEVQLAQIRDRLHQLRELDKRREAILKSLVDQGKLTSELEEKVRAAETMAALEDIYLPYRPKRKTRASVARDRGLEPLAQLVMRQDGTDVREAASAYVDDAKSVNDVEDALAGARDIIAETIAEDAAIRAKTRQVFLEKGTFAARVVPGKEEEALKYKDYHEWTEPLKTAPSHRILAMRRGEKEELLYLDIEVPETDVLPLLDNAYVKGAGEASTQVRMAMLDGYKRLLKPAMETEVRMLTRQRADEEAIRVFAGNVRQLLLAAPLGQKRLMAIDPGFRTGCKTVCLDEQGALLENTTLFLHTGTGGAEQAAKTIHTLIEKHQLQAIAIGNGTAGRETEAFVRKLDIPNVAVVMVNESGASIYSASDTARAEFPDHDVTVRGAVSIGRRLMDPLAELVKIDPKSIGVGQYQHDVDQSKLQHSLDDTVVSCVNAVGVELNTASKEILSYISGLGPSLAQQIINFRQAHGAFRNRESLKQVPRLGEKAFEQAAGFLRIRNAQNPLDASAVHPERYALVAQMAADLGCEVADLLRDEHRRKQIELKKYVSEHVGMPTLHDILAELAKPGRDPREQFEPFSFTEGVNRVADLRIGMRLPGIVTNITNFGAFVDIGVHQDGLVHLSQLANRFVKDPNELIKVQQKVMVTVTEVDEKRNRISLSMKTEERPAAKQNERPKKQNERPKKQRKPTKARQAETDMAAKLAALKSKFGS